MKVISRKALSLFLTIAMLLSIVPMSSISAFAASSGSGTKADPYLISTLDQLKEVSDHSGAGIYYKLVNDITVDSGTPQICDFNHQFAGNFDGNWKTITIHSSSSTVAYAGLFGYIDDTGIVQNLNVTADINILQSHFDCGALAAVNYGKIYGCHASGTVKDSGDTVYIGGLVGANAGTIINSSAAVAVTGGDNTHAGGLVGHNSEYAYIQNCSATGPVAGGESLTANVHSSVGGFVGCSDQNAVILASYATGDVTGDRNIGTGAAGTDFWNCTGGFAGESWSSITGCFATGAVTDRHTCSDVAGFMGDNYGTITGCFATGEVTGDNRGSAHGLNAMYGGFVGDNSGAIQVCYAAGTVTGTSTNTNSGFVCKNESPNGIISGYYNRNAGPGVGNGVGATTVTAVAPDDMKTAAFADMLNTATDRLGNVNYYWKSDSSVNNGYPMLVSVFDGGTGTAEDPYLISSANQLKHVKFDLNASYRLTANITVDAIEPIGIDNETYYTGTFDGNGKTVTVTNPITNTQYVGLFAYTGTDAVIENLTVAANVASTGDDNFAGIIAAVNCGKIDNCHASGTVSATGSTAMVGGLVGDSAGAITDSTADVTVTASGLSSYAGGLVGNNLSYAYIQNCSSTGTVTASGAGTEGSPTAVGGLVGYSGSNAVIIASSAAGTVMGGQYVAVGGLVGENEGSVTGCYATGNAQADETDSDIGGLVGHNGDKITLCYATGTVNGSRAASKGGLVGSETGIITDGYYNSQCGAAYGVGGIADQTGILAKTPDYLKTAAFANDLNRSAAMQNLNYCWKIISGRNSGYPVLTATFTSGSGTAEDPYLITDVDQLGLVSNNLNASYKLMTNIDAGNITPIGNQGDPFTGTFDGNGQTLTLSIDTASQYAGLFGYLGGSGTVVKNLTVAGTVKDSAVTGLKYSFGEMYVGGLAGSMDENATVSNCHSKCNVIASVTDDMNGQAGGLVGENGGSITNCSAEGTVRGTNSGSETGSSLYNGGLAGLNEGKITSSYATGAVTGSGKEICNGGFVGKNQDGEIANCYTTGSVAGSAADAGHTDDITQLNAGGFVGKNQGSIGNCYATGSVQGSAVGKRTATVLGGFVGLNYDVIEDCYATSAVTGTQTTTKLSDLYNQPNTENGTVVDVGGFAGINTRRIFQCYFDTQTTGQTANIGETMHLDEVVFGKMIANSSDATGLTTAKMTGTAAKNNMTGFDFDDEWAATANTVTSWYYPQLQVFLPSLDSVTVIQKISGFDPLPDDTKTRAVANGTTRSDLKLPTSLTATISGAAQTITGITWTESPAYVPTTAGTYLFTAVLPSGYELASGVALPQITVTVAAISGGSSNHTSSKTTTPTATVTNETKVDGTGNTAVVTTKPSSVTVSGKTTDIQVVVSNITTDNTLTPTNGTTVDMTKKTSITIDLPNDEIKQQLAAKQNVELTVTVPSDAAKDANANAALTIKADKEIFEAAKESQTDLTIKIKDADTQQFAYTWTFKGTDLAKSTTPVTDVNIAMSVHLTTEIPAVNAITPLNKGLVLSFDHSGVLPSVASVKFSALDKGFKPGQTLYFYYYNPATKQIESLGKDAYTVDADGNVTVQISHCSNYVLLPKQARTITLDTRSYIMKPNKSYEIGVKLTGISNPIIKAYSSTKGTADVTVLKNGNVKATGRKPGHTYIMIDVYDSKSKFLTHASIRLTVVNGVKENGNSARQYGIF